MKLTLQQLEAHLWGAANIPRGKTAGQDYKNYILSLMFYKRLYYVGLATNLYWRLVSHTKNKNRGNWDSLAISRVGWVRYRKDIESLLLRVAAPPGNAVSGHVHRDADLTKVLEKIQHERTRRLQRIWKALE